MTSRRAQLRAQALEILRCALKAVDPVALFKTNVRRQGHWLSIQGRRFDLDRIGRLIVIGAGKGAAPLAAAAEEILGDRIAAGAVIVKYSHSLPLAKTKVLEAGHPLPDPATLAGSNAILETLRDLGENDLVLVLLTGGGSALLECPPPGLSLNDLQTTAAALLSCGADIAEINAVRKHLSRVKGGQLLQAASPARVVTLAVSDVIGDAPEAIASGPTVPDPSTFADALQVVQKYRLQDKLPAAVLNHLERGLRGNSAETPKPGDPLFARSAYHIIGNNRLLLKAAQSAAQGLGYQSIILTDQMHGEARLLGRRLAALFKTVKPRPKQPICLLTGGETTVTLRGSGMGGRNQELALAAAIELDGTRNCLLLSAGSDGTDGPTDAAGAICDGASIARARALGLNAEDFLNRNDSYNFFKPLNDLVITGPTLTNVMDLVIMLKS